MNSLSSPARLLTAALLPVAVLYAAEPKSGQATKGLPHIVFALTDDLGWNYPGFHNEEIISPTLDRLAKEGVRYKYCSPSRGSFLTGRYPWRLAASRCNLIPSSIPEGLDLGYGTIADMLGQRGYATHHIGKWHQGFHHANYTPVARGFNTSFGFLEGGEDHWAHTCNAGQVKCGVPPLKNGGFDLWLQNNSHFPGQPSYGLNGTKGDLATYSGYIFPARAVDLIKRHAAEAAAEGAVESPLFMFLSLHNTHAPVEAPQRFIDLYDFGNDTKKATFSAMVSVVDESVLNVTQALKAANMWDNTLFIWTTDNGSPVQVAGSNHPLRGGKGSNWEGGVRVPTFITGGVVPEAMQGKRLDGLVAVADWIHVFASLAGTVVPSSGPSPSDGVDVWPYLSGATSASPRGEIVLDHHMFDNSSGVEGCAGQDPWQWKDFKALGSLRIGDYKLLVGPEYKASWFGSFSPNATGPPPDINAAACLDQPCLFNLAEDPSEHVDLSASMPDKVQEMLKRWVELENSYHPRVVPPPQQKTAFCEAIQEHGGWVAPYLDDVVD